MPHEGHGTHMGQRDGAGHMPTERHQGHHADAFLRKFWIVLALTVPLVLYSDLPRLFFGWNAPDFRGSGLVQVLIASIVYVYGGAVFLRGARDEIASRLPGMMTLIALAISAAYFYSVYATLSGMGMNLFWELSTLIAVMLIGHWVEMKAVRRAKGALSELAKLLPDSAEVERGGKTVTIRIEELKEGDVVLVRPGQKIPADGSVIEGESEVNESLITGESRLVQKSSLMDVVAGSINGDGSLRVRVNRIGDKTYLAGIMRLVAEAERSKSRLQLLSDKAARYLTYLALGAGSVTFISWNISGAEFSFAMERLVAVLVIACPHALGLAIPLVASISTDIAAANGFFIKKRLALEAARTITTVLFDKTGTLTKGEFAVTEASSEEALSLAASVEKYSEHPIAKAVLASAEARGIRIDEARDFRRIPGAGAEATIAGRRVFVGHRGGDDIIVEADGGQVGTIVVADVVRPEAREAVAAIMRMGIRVAMITGDSNEVAAAVAKDLNIDQYFARVRPEEKADKVRLLQEAGEKVAMVGDGVNDAPALTGADLGVAIGAGTNVALESAGIILVRNDPRDVQKIILLSRLTYVKMIQNLFWATGYNVLALPVAAGALFSWGITLEPALAAVFMSLSTVVVAINAILLRRTRLD